MQVFSATQSISPAVERTKSLLFRPFRWRTFLKLCAAALFTEGYTGSFNYSNSHRTSHFQTASAHLHFTPAMAAVLVAVGLLALVLAVAILYLMVRLRFALFECLIRQSTLIKPGWSLYRAQARRFFLLCIAVGLVFVVVLIAVALPFVFGFLRLFRDYHSGDHFPVAGFFSLLLPLIPLILLLLLAGIVIDIVLRDFMLPHIALDNATVGQAWAAVRASLAHEKGEFLLYAVLRVFIPLFVCIAILVALIIPCAIVFGALALLMVGLGAAMTHAAGAEAVFFGFSAGLTGLVIMALALLVAISFFGPVCISLRNYALVFYGGRYPALGGALWPQSPPPAQIVPGVA